MLHLKWTVYQEKFKHLSSGNIWYKKIFDNMRRISVSWIVAAKRCEHPSSSVVEGVDVCSTD